MSQLFTVQSKMQHALVISLAAACCIIAVGGQYICEKGWTLFDGQCHFIPSIQRSWSGGRQYCQSQFGADLVTIRNAAKNSFVKSFKGKIDLWIGLNDIKVENRFVWLSERAKATFYDWQPGEPNNDHEDCVEFEKDDSWNDQDCPDIMYFMCQKEAGIETTSSLGLPLSTEVTIVTPILTEAFHNGTFPITVDGCASFSKVGENLTFSSPFRILFSKNHSDCARECVNFTDCQGFALDTVNGHCYLGSQIDLIFRQNFIVYTIQ